MTLQQPSSSSLKSCQIHVQISSFYYPAITIPLYHARYGVQAYYLAFFKVAYGVGQFAVAAATVEFQGVVAVEYKGVAFGVVVFVKQAL